MSLDWKLPKDFNLNLVWKDETKDEVKAELYCLIFGTMTICHDLTGEMTDDKLKEISRRIKLLNQTGCLMSYSVSHNNDYEKVSLSLESVIRYWGLWTNVSHKKPKEWDKMFIKMNSIDEYVFKSEKEKALEVIKDYPDLIEGERILKLWKEKEMVKIKEKSDELTTT